MGRTGFEHPHDPSVKSMVASEGGANCGALSGDSDTKPAPATPPDPDLSVVIAAWPNVPVVVRAGIVAMVKAARER